MQPVGSVWNQVAKWTGMEQNIACICTHKLCRLDARAAHSREHLLAVGAACLGHPSSLGQDMTLLLKPTSLSKTTGPLPPCLSAFQAPVRMCTKKILEGFSQRDFLHTSSTPERLHLLPSHKAVLLSHQLLDGGVIQDQAPLQRSLAQAKEGGSSRELTGANSHEASSQDPRQAFCALIQRTSCCLPAPKAMVVLPPESRTHLPEQQPARALLQRGVGVAARNLGLDVRQA